jgi:tRNA pseudouridine55 synthase
MELHGLINIDKPLGWTSHDVVGKLRRILNTRKIGHAGTLDPAATGVLVVGVGRATRFLDYVQSTSKQYLAHVVLGVESETADIDGTLDQTVRDHVRAPSLELVESTLSAFVGSIDQIPPKYSAIKQEGVPIYRRARRGEDVDVPVRTVSVAELSVEYYEYPDLILNLTCGSGFYVRALARDVGESLGTGGYLHHLVRTRVGRFSLASATRIETLESESFPEAWTSIATGIDAGIDELDSIWLAGESEASWYHGRSIAAVESTGRRSDSNKVRAFAMDGTFAGIGRLSRTSESHVEIQPSVVLPGRH